MNIKEQLNNLSIRKPIKPISQMHTTTLDLFCNDDNNEDNDIREVFDSALEEQAAKYEVTVDYYIEEFLV
jgi:hypothetical protein